MLFNLRLRYFALGFFVGLFIFFAMKSMVAEIPTGSPWTAYGTVIFRNVFGLAWVYNYQTLIGAAIALYGAAWAANAVFKQTSEQKLAQKQLLDGKRAAALATLPFALSSASAYIEASVNMLFDAYKQCKDGELPKSASIMVPPDIDGEILLTLKENIEFFEENRLFLSDFIATWQIQNSRLKGIEIDQKRDEHITLTLNITSCLYDTAELSVQISALFDYVRDGSEKGIGEIRNSDITRELRSLLLLKDLDLALHISTLYKLQNEDFWLPSYRRYKKTEN